MKKPGINKQGNLSLEDYVRGVISGDRTTLSRAITLVESSLREHQETAQQILEKCLPYAGNSIRVGITGIPGVGKSTFIDSLGKILTSKGRKLAVLAIDPSSKRSGGSILGDKTRMNELAVDPNAFIRPSPSSGTLGGVARATRETIILFEAAGFDTIMVETVGVGQSETAVYSMVDFFLLLMLPGAGDELQGIKRGIMEMADAIAINKADGDNINKAQMALTEYSNALHLFPPSASGWVPRVETCSSITKEGLEKIWNIVEEFELHSKAKGFFQNNRQEQSKFWMYETINEDLKNIFYGNKAIKDQLLQLENQVVEGKITSFSAARKLVNTFLGNKN